MEAVITITDSHENNDGETESCELTTVGTYLWEEGCCSIVYDETDSELAGSTTTIKVEGGKTVTLTRVGKYNTEMIIDPGKRHQGSYITPFGELRMGVYSRSVNSALTEDGGTLDLCYTVDFNSALVSVNTLNIKVKKAGADDVGISQ